MGHTGYTLFSDPCSLHHRSAESYTIHRNSHRRLAARKALGRESSEGRLGAVRPGVPHGDRWTKNERQWCGPSNSWLQWIAFTHTHTISILGCASHFYRICGVFNPYTTPTIGRSFPYTMGYQSLAGKAPEVASCPNGKSDVHQNGLNFFWWLGLHCFCLEDTILDY